MIAFVMHEGSDSSDVVMFDESFEQWWSHYQKDHQNDKFVFEKLGEINSCQEFGRIYRRLSYKKGETPPANADDATLIEWCKKYGPEPMYVVAFYVTPSLKLTFGD